MENRLLKSPSAILALLLLSSCVSSTVLFQDGKTAGKKEADVAFGVSYNLSPTFHDTDTLTRKAIIKPYRIPAPYLQIQGQYGVAKNLDLGGSIGLGLLSGGGSLFVKYCFLPNLDRFHASLYGSGSVSASDEKIGNDEVLFYQYMVAVPFDFELSDGRSLVIQPIYSHDYYRVTLRSDYKYRGQFNTEIYHLGFGYLVEKKRKEGDTFFNITLNYAPDRLKVYPTFGVAARR